ncbi:MAG: Nramp family divalent metal transporter [Streptococcaceae bacterium]|jgi:manganese transport protein|nr:Nramp family divalent metal transporter [Streptococcaceae bacterium]
MESINKFNTISLEEVNGTVKLPKKKSFWRYLLAYSGPGALVAVGYMDPGNWITDLKGGASFGYLLLSVVLVSSCIAMILQYMSAKLGIVTQMDLAQATRNFTGKKLSFVLWIIIELALMATDVAEVIGGAIAFNLLFGLPLLAGIIIEAADVFLLLALMNMGFRKVEAIVVCLILVIMAVFAYEVILSQPHLGALFGGFVPQKEVLHPHQLSLALGILGAIVMPHSLYLHSSIVQTRQYKRDDEESIAEALKYATWDSNIQLTIALVVNCLLLILGASMFFGKGAGINSFTAIYHALGNPQITGSIASPILGTLFALALLASGQNSTITGTLTGQIAMEGFIQLKVPIFWRRIITRLITVIPVVIIALIFGAKESVLDNLLVNSQIFLSLALPFSMIPLVLITSSKKIMGRFVNKPIIIILGSVFAILLTVLNVQLILSII